MKRVGVLLVALEQLVASPEVAKLDRRRAEVCELAPQLLLAQLGGVVAAADRRDFLRDLGAELPLDLVLLPPELQDLRVSRAEPLPLGAEVEDRQVQLLDARTAEEVSERVAVRPGEEIVSAVEREPGAFRLAEQTRDVRDPLRDGLLLFVDGHVRVLGSEAAERRLRTLRVLPRLAQLATEELLGRDVVGAPRLLIGLQIGLRVGRREEGREGGARRREPHRHEVGPADLLDGEVAHVAVDQGGIDRPPTRAPVLGGPRRSGLEAARPEESERGPAERQAAAPAGARIEEGLAVGESTAADDALGQVPALQSRHLRAEEGRGAVRGQVAVAEPEHIALEAELDGGLPRELEPRRRGVEARREERGEDRQPEREPEAGGRQPAVLVEHPEVLPQVARRLAELRVDDRRWEVSARRCRLRARRVGGQREQRSIGGGHG